MDLVLVYHLVCSLECDSTTLYKGENTDIQQGFTFVAYTVEEQTVR